MMVGFSDEIFTMNLPIIFAFLTVILIWSTTPLGIKWSADTAHISFLFGVASRMSLACGLSLFIIAVLRIPFQLHTRAIKAHLVSGLGIYVSMMACYWGATYVSSGWLAVLWGTSPFATALLATVFLNETLTRYRVVGMLFALAGLLVIFLHALQLERQTFIGVGIILVGMLGQTSSAVALKYINAQQHGLVMTAGGLSVSVPLFVLTWFLFDGQYPQEIPDRVLYSILYLASVGSVLGFSLYYYLIHKVQASQVSLITFISPVGALYIGYLFNHEMVTDALYIGTGLILLGLLFFEYGHRFKFLRKITLFK